ncbi:MAG: beta-galactosidase [Dysgonomonas sp.]|nr:beta-galactosidase [Dysgonomonas sp.]
MKLYIKAFILLFCLLGGINLYSQNANFTIGENSFLLNGKPFVIKAAEIHYPRIPSDYWEHRIRMCKALGMNTICIYTFWNIHEPQPNEFDFQGQNDIVRFCRLAQKHGMYIILRPGPYVCAEWEMGGLPWWLLKKEDIVLRSKDSYFMERTKKYFNAIGKQLADMQIDRGGNIIMVQVENEFGSYGTDKEYVSQIRDAVKNAGFTDVPLFQCDWSSNFMNNALDDLLWTINFGTGANIEEQFSKLKHIRPQTPLMCSEFWSGWFDHWGRAHETRNAAAMVEGLKEMLDNNISFSLYMTHGGTTFGHWGGANSPRYSAMCSSYDYDAPISEAGWVTEKYFKVRDLLSGYLQTGEQLPDIPSSIPTIQIPEIKLTESALVFDNLPAPKISKEIKPMEYFNQGWGSILYRTYLPEIQGETSIVMTQLHDWAQVYIDGKLIKRLDRRRDENIVNLSAVKKGARLDILVEAMGRVNFDEAIHDRKGITEKVELIHSKGIKNLQNWEVYNLPLDYEFVKNKNYNVTNILHTMPSYYKGKFNLEQVGDVFIDMQQWGKGLVWINGKSIGRFWKIGPQQTLFVPGCWLRKGENEIIVLEHQGTETTTIRGLDKPILDMLRPEEFLLNRKEGETLNLENDIPVYKGEFLSGNGWKNIRFDRVVEARYICLEGLSAYDGNVEAAIAELHITGANGENVSRQNWKIIYADSENLWAGNNSADKVFDLQESTYWKTAGGQNYPHQIVVDLGKNTKIEGLKYLPRVEEGAPGLIREFRFYAKLTPFLIEK